jgi:uncharacterized membrane protein
MKETIKKKLGEEQYRRIDEALKKKKISIEDIMKLSPKERIDKISELCSETKLDFKEVYSAFETAKEEKMEEHALRSAVAAIFAREGPIPQSNPQLYKDIKRKIEETEEK